MNPDGTNDDPREEKRVVTETEVTPEPPTRTVEETETTRTTEIPASDND